MRTIVNKTGKKKLGGIAVIFLLFSLLPVMVMVDSGSAFEGKLTLPEAVRTALENNHELKALRNSHAAKQADIGIARSFLLPKISLEERYLRTVNPTYAFMTKLNQQRIESSDFAPDSLNHPEAVNDFQTAVSFEQPLFVRKATIGLEMSKKEVEASEETLQRKKAPGRISTSPKGPWGS
jgi:outer membrane protein TolC